MNRAARATHKQRKRQKNKTANVCCQHSLAEKPPGKSPGKEKKRAENPGDSTLEKVKGDPAHSRRIPLPEYRPPYA